MPERRGLLEFILDSIEYDFREDDDEVQGSWDVKRDEDIVTVAYEPFDDSPYPADRMTYKITRVDRERM